MGHPALRGSLWCDRMGCQRKYSLQGFHLLSPVIIDFLSLQQLQFGTRNYIVMLNVYCLKRANDFVVSSSRVTSRHSCL